MRSSAPGEGPCIKGASLREFLLWYERRVGRDAVHALAASVPPELALHVKPEMLAFGMLASSWYPIALAHFCLDRIIEGRGDEGRELAREANCDVVPRMIRGVYKVLYRTLASPELYSRHIGRQWRTLHSTGDRAFTVRAPGEGYSVVANWPGHHPFLCWSTIYTMTCLFEAMGYAEVTADRIRCVSHGAEDCATIVRWR